MGKYEGRYAMILAEMLVVVARSYRLKLVWLMSANRGLRARLNDFRAGFQLSTPDARITEFVLK